MSLADSLQRAKLTGPPCSVGAIASQLDPDDRATLTAWLADPTMQGTAIARALRAEGYSIQGQTVNRHRNGECRCGTR